MPDSSRTSTLPTVYSAVYTSAETEPFSDEDLTRLLEHCRAANETADVTGVLLYRRGRFVQFLEGDESTVRTLLQKIRTDPRHQGFRILVDDVREPRHFPHWTMGFVTEDSGPASMPIGFRTAFNDIDAIDDRVDAAAVRALREISHWFRPDKN